MISPRVCVRLRASARADPMGGSRAPPPPANAAPRLGSDHLGVRQHARDGGDRDAGARGDVLDRPGGRPVRADRLRRCRRRCRPGPPAPRRRSVAGAAALSPRAPPERRRRGGAGAAAVGSGRPSIRPPAGRVAPHRRDRRQAHGRRRGTSNRQPVELVALAWPVYPITLGMSSQCKRLPGAPSSRNDWPLSRTDPGFRAGKRSERRPR